MSESGEASGSSLTATKMSRLSVFHHYVGFHIRTSGSSRREGDHYEYCPIDFVQNQSALTRKPTRCCRFSRSNCPGKISQRHSYFAS